MPSTASRPLVVIVEADPALADTLAMLIDDWGFRALHCASAKTAIRALGTGLGDVAAIITDYQPLDGFAGIGEASRIMAATGRRIPTIVTSGHPFHAEHQHVFPVLHKPFDPLVLKQWLNDQFRQSQTVADHKIACGERSV